MRMATAAMCAARSMRWWAAWASGLAAIPVPAHVLCALAHRTQTHSTPTWGSVAWLSSASPPSSPSTQVPLFCPSMQSRVPALNISLEAVARLPRQ